MDFVWPKPEQYDRYSEEELEVMARRRVESTPILQPWKEAFFFFDWGSPAPRKAVLYMVAIYNIDAINDFLYEVDYHWKHIQQQLEMMKGENGT